MNEADSRTTIDNSLANLAKNISEAHSVLDVLEACLANVLSPQTARQNQIEKLSASPTRFALVIDGQRERVSSLTMHLREIINRLDIEVPPTSTDGGRLTSSPLTPLCANATKTKYHHT